MNDAAVDEIGIRVTPPNLVYSNGQTFSFFGSGILNKPIGDFTAGTYSVLGWLNTVGAPYIAERSNQGHFSIRVQSRAIPEPEGYMLIAGFAALLYVVIRNAYDKRNEG